MARFQFNPLPTVDPTTQPVPMQRINASPAAFGAGVGAAMGDAAAATSRLGATLEQTGDVANRHALAFQALNNETDARAGTTEYQNKIRAIGFGDPGDPEAKGFFTLKGKSAFDSAKPTMEAAEKARDEILAKMPNDASRLMARTAMDAHLSSFEGDVARTAAQGRVEWMTNVHVASVDAYKNSAIDYYNDPAKVQTSILMAKRETLSLGELSGKPPEMVVQEQKKVESDIRVGIIDRMVTDDPLAAQSYYGKNADTVLPEDRARVEKALKAATTPVLTANVVNSVVNGAPGPNPELKAVVAQAESGGRDTVPDYGPREDGTRKGTGFFGMLKRPDGKASSEISIGVEINGKETLIPSMVPGLTDAEMKSLLNGDKPSASIVQKAAEHAKARMAKGLSPFANNGGDVITSPKGAKGIMQVMDGTFKNPGFGVAPAKDDSLAERKRVGDDYLDAMLQRYGNQTVALAAYNWGPGKVDEVLEKMGSAPGKSGSVDAAAFLAKTPPETRAYVAGINSKAPPVAGQLPTSENIDKIGPEWVKDARRRAEQTFKNQPGAVEQVVNGVEGRVAEIKRGQVVQERAARDTMMSTALGLVATPSGGYTQTPPGSRPTTLDALLTSPQAKAAWGQMDVTQQIGVLSVLKQNAGGTNPTETQASLSKYYELTGKAANDPEAFVRMNLADKTLLDLLPHEKVTSLMGMQRTMQMRENREAAKGQELKNALSIAAPMIKSAGIYYTVAPSTKGFNQDKAATYDQFVGRLNESIGAYVEANKKSPDADAVRKMTGTLLAEGSERGSGWFWDKSVRLFETDTTKFAAKVPDEERPKIMADYRARFGKDPSAGMVEDIYKAHIMRTGGAR